MHVEFTAIITYISIVCLAVPTNVKVLEVDKFTSTLATSEELGFSSGRNAKMYVIQSCVLVHTSSVCLTDQDK